MKIGDSTKYNNNEVGNVVRTNYDENGGKTEDRSVESQVTRGEGIATYFGYFVRYVFCGIDQSDLNLQILENKVNRKIKDQKSEMYGRWIYQLNKFKLKS